jgi:Ankyrin repeats (3 copies)
MTIEIEDSVRNAAKSGDVAALKALVALYGPTVVRLGDDPSELTALHLASASGIVEAVRYLLGAPVEADPRAARNNNFTPLHAAAMHLPHCVGVRTSQGPRIHASRRRFTALPIQVWGHAEPRHEVSRSS